ncbi:GNAT family N-acetyltransferase [Nocardioides sp. R-C-SC26]|uniref:GNAT family N-acetyltransferase n=1 Tax=Nocardioides sp. R-C-SC26 TaxID=2870414 RepID=UPI001E2A8EF2|nr:GNAT family N-acetyltransferase [Nocardioides sp. R-C-SC26]
MRIRRIDPRDDAVFDGWHAVYAAAECEGMAEYATIWSRRECQEMYAGRASPFVDHRVYLGTVDGEPVCTGYLRIPLQDNLDAAMVQVCTAPGRRRAGHGTQMLAELERELAELGRTRLDAQASWPETHGAQGEDWPGREFALARGFRLTLGEVQRELALPVPDAVLDDLELLAATRHEGYRLHRWSGPVPDEFAEGWVTLAATLATEAPMGEGEHEDDVADVEALRQTEEMSARQGRVDHAAIALAPDGELVAYTQIQASSDGTGRAYQWGTLVRSDHRGHRLGLAVKVANLRQLQESGTTDHTVVTWNAEVNAHMIGVNEQLGFRPVARAGEFQKRLPSRA